MTRLRGLSFALSIALLASGFLLARTSYAQTFRGTILGTVTDASGAAVPDAKITARNVNTGLERTAETSTDGSYAISELPVGTYDVTIARTGFETSVTKSVAVDVASEKRIDAVLRPGQLSQQVVVSAGTLPQVDTTSDVIGGVMTSSQITSLPINGRDYQKLIYLNPGIAGSPDQISDSPGSFGIFSMNGARGRSNNFLLDGTDMNDGYRNDPAINEAGVFGDPATILPVESIAELRVLSNYEPEYGRNAGAVINIVTKSGTNALHGSVLEYFRNNALDARNFFNVKGTPQNAFHNNQFGGSLGGPIRKDKTFFFADYEGQRETGAQATDACVPDPGQIAFDGGATNPVVAALLARNPWPTPNIGTAPAPGTPGLDTGCPNGPNLSVSTDFSNRVDSLIAKIDHSITRNNLLSGRYYFGDSDQSFPLALVGGGVLPGFNTVTPTRVQLVALSLVSVLSGEKVNEVRLGWNRFAEGFFSQDSTFNPSSIGLNTGVTNPFDFGLPKITVGSFAVLGANVSDPRHRVDSNWQFLDNFTWKTGRHDIKFGYEFRRTSISQILDTNFRGKLSFGSLSSFLQGTPGGGSQATGSTDRNTFENNHGVYIQDSFRWTSRLALNYGIRWDYYGVITEKHGLFFNFDPNNPTPAPVQVGSPGLPSLYQPDYKNFAPRFSFAYDIFGTGKTVVRGGYGIFYDAYSQDFFLGHLPFNCTFCPGPAYAGIGPNGTAIGFASANTTPLNSAAPVYGGERRWATFSRPTATSEHRTWKISISISSRRSGALAFGKSDT